VIGLVKENVSFFVRRLCKRLCASRELALCLDLILGKEDLVGCVQISCPLQSCSLWLCAQELRNVEILKTNK
jgi:hypothetical protein